MEEAVYCIKYKYVKCEYSDNIYIHFGYVGLEVVGKDVVGLEEVGDAADGLEVGYAVGSDVGSAVIFNIIIILYLSKVYII